MLLLLLPYDLSQSTPDRDEERDTARQIALSPPESKRC